MKSNLTGIILAGGQSQRMGLDKGLVEFCGKALIMNAIEILKPLCSDIIISTNKLKDA